MNDHGKIKRLEKTSWFMETVLIYFKGVSSIFYKLLDHK